MYGIQDFTPIGTQPFLLRVKNDPTRRIGEFESILRNEIEKHKFVSVPKTKNDKKLLDLGYEMEAIFIGQMLRTMRNTILETDFFGKSIAKDIFSDMLYDEYAKLMARTDQFGLARQIVKQLRV